MSPLIKKWIELDAAYRAALRAANKAFDRARANAIMPKKLRPATADDCARVGQVIWYPEDRAYDFSGWHMVMAPLNYGCEFKAYTAEDGCRYGLEGAFVAVERKRS